MVSHYIRTLLANVELDKFFRIKYPKLSEYFLSFFENFIQNHKNFQKLKFFLFFNNYNYFFVVILNMIYYKSSFKVTSYSSEQSLDFLKKVKLLTKKIKIGDKSLIFSKLNKKSNQNTILRSPHVNKKARDQIKIDHIYNLVSSKNKNIYKILMLINANTSYKGNFTYIVNEKVYFFIF